MGSVLDLAALKAVVAQRRQAGERVALTNGVFDLLHLGHVRYLTQARALGDLLLVAVNSDASTRRLKGASRPFTPEEERAEVLVALSAVDYVTIFDEATATDVVRALRPDIYVKGADYAGADAARRATDHLLAPDDLRRLVAGDASTLPALAGIADRLPEARAVAAYGGALALLSYLPGHSTTDLLARIRASDGTAGG